MCGITGIINWNNKQDGIAGHIKRMTDAIRHRGPDGEGFLFYDGTNVISTYGKDTPENIIASPINYAPQTPVESFHGENIRFAFGHRRLSIIDVSSAGHQPMCDAEKKIWIIFNGEIYNHIELRQELSKKGIVFRTITDTEVIIQSYIYWGEDCVNHFNGMWSFVIFDSRKNILFGSRDRVGVKPFYYYNDENIFAFASEQKAIMKLPYVKSGINFKAASTFLVGDIQYIERGEENMFKNIFEVMPAQNIRIDLKTNTFQKWTYYSLSTNISFSSFIKSDFDLYRNKTETLLMDTIKLRMRSDVPVGSCLSGGIDSSVIVSMMSQLSRGDATVNFGGNLKVFTLSFDDPAIDESKWAKLVVDQTQAEWYKVSPTVEGMLKDLSDLNYAQDIPICSTSTYGQFQLMHAAKQAGIKVILDGQGGDELFGGYLSYSIIFWRELLRNWRFNKFFHEAAQDGKFPFHLKQMGKDFLKRGFSQLTPRFFQVQFYQSYFRENKFLNKNLIREFICSDSFASELDISNSTSLNQALWKDFTNARLKMYLKYEDRSSMWHSIEARTPFADDHRLVEYVFSIPATYKIHNGINKYLLREATAQFLPEPIKNRKDKLGLVTPVDSWVKQMQNYFMDYLDDSVSEYMNVKEIKNNYKKFFDVSNHADGVRVFRMISFAVWKKLFNL